VVRYAPPPLEVSVVCFGTVWLGVVCDLPPP